MAEETTEAAKPATLAEALMRIEELEAEAKRLSEYTEGWRQRAIEAEQSERAMKKERDETREQFADLKKRVRDAMLDAARLEGYRERVHEEDRAREPLVEIQRKQVVRASDIRAPGERNWQAFTTEGRSGKDWIEY